MKNVNIYAYSILLYDTKPYTGQITMNPKVNNFLGSNVNTQSNIESLWGPINNNSSAYLFSNSSNVPSDALAFSLIIYNISQYLYNDQQ